MRPLGILGLFVALTVVFAYPLSLNPGRFIVPGDADSDLFMWTLAWATHALFARPWDLFDANIYYPLRHTFAFSENLLGSLPFAAPVLWTTGNPVLAVNAVALSSVALCGIGSYLLARRLGLSAWAAVICGIIFAFAPSRFYRYGQLHLTTVQWIPFTLAYLHTYFERRHRRDLWIAAGFFSLQVLATGHGAVFVAIAAAIVVLVELPIRRGLAAIRQPIVDCGWQGLVLLLPSLLLFIPYRMVQQETGLRRSLVNWSAVPESFLASPSHVHTALHTWLAGRNVNETATAFMFAGWLPVALTTVAVAIGWRGNGRILAAYGILGVLSLLLAAGEPISLWPFVYWMPGFNFIRVPSRFIILTTLAIAVLAAVGFDAVARRWTPRARAACAVGAALLLCVEFATMPFTGRATRVEIPAVDRRLAERPRPFSVAELPVGSDERWHSGYMLHSMAHWQRTVHGHSGIRMPVHDELYAALRRFPDAAGVAMLQRLGVDYLVVHTDAYEPGQWPDVERRLATFSHVLVLEEVVGTGRIYSVRKPVDAVQ